MNYKIIQDKDELLKFLDWLPDNTKEQKYYLNLMARKKYNKIVPSDKQCLKRVVANKKDIISKIEQMETRLGTYKTNDIDIPNNSLVLYISINPRDMKRACFNTSVALIRKIQEGLIPNPKSVALDEIQKSAVKNFVTFDIDSKENFLENKDKLLDIFGIQCYNYIESNGGYHLIVDLSKLNNSSWYNELLNTFNVDQKGDLLSPIPGCIQGSFIPRLF